MSPLVLYAALGLDALRVGMFDLFHLCYCVGNFYYAGVGVASCQDDVHHLGLLLERGHYYLGIQHLVGDGVIDLVEDYQVPDSGMDGGFGLGPGFLHHAYVFGIRN